MVARATTDSTLAIMPRRSKAEREAEAYRPYLVEDEPLDLPPPPEPPEHLSPAMQRWWTAVVTTYVLEAHHLRVLECACDAWDEMVQARETVRREGFVISTAAGGGKKNPACDIERDNRIAFVRCVRELDLDITEAPRVDKHNWPPKLKSNRNG
jgi:P27 family predicted phage terminase small subunit